MHLDAIDRLAAATLDGYLVRKDLVRTFSRQFPVPTYVVEFLLGRYCASTDPEEIDEGIEIVQRQLADRTVKAFDASKSGAKLGIAILVARCTALLKKTTRGGLIIIGEINLGGSIEPIHNAVIIAEMAVEIHLRHQPSSVSDSGSCTGSALKDARALPGARLTIFATRGLARRRTTV